jgi:predicted SnoaL-like aldol condensation-catalyzing enzyme
MSRLKLCIIDRFIQFNPLKGNGKDRLVICFTDYLERKF